LPKKYYAVFVTIGLFLAMFSSWREEREKCEKQKTEAAKEAAYIAIDMREPTYSPNAFVVDKPLKWNVQYPVYGQYPALNVISWQKAYIEEGEGESYQKDAADQFKQEWEVQVPSIKNWNDQTPSFFPNSPAHWGTASGPVLKAEDIKAFTLGTKTVFVVAAARFKDAAGFHDAHACFFLQPPAKEGRSPYIWHQCVVWNAPVDVK